MTKEQREAIKSLNEFANTKYGAFTAKEGQTVLSMLKEQQEENKKKDKIIDLMTEYIAILEIEEEFCVKTGKNLNKCDSMALGGCENCIKQYFKSKAEKE